MGDCLFDDSLSFALFGNIRRQDKRRVADFSCNSIEKVLAAAHQCHARAFLRKCQGARAANATASAGDDGYLTFQARTHSVVSVSLALAKKDAVC